MSETMDTTNILVCDDDKEIAGAIEIYLRNEGYHVFKAYNGVEALRIAREQPLQLIIMDIMMPQMDGVQATMKIREEKNIPIIMLSAKSEDYDKITGLNVGADDYVTKPFNPLELVARVKSQLRRYVRLGSIDGAAGEKASGQGAVSYTHLDVYKRQVVDRGVMQQSVGKDQCSHNRDECGRNRSKKGLNAHAL